MLRLRAGSVNSPLQGGDACQTPGRWPFLGTPGTPLRSRFTTCASLVGVVLVNCQLAEHDTQSFEEAVSRSLAAITDEHATQYEAFRRQFGSTSRETVS